MNMYVCQKYIYNQFAGDTLTVIIEFNVAVFETMYFWFGMRAKNFMSPQKKMLFFKKLHAKPFVIKRAKWNKFYHATCHIHMFDDDPLLCLVCSHYTSS